MCLTIGSLHLVVASRLTRGAHLAFGLTALTAAGNAFIEPLAWNARDVAGYTRAFSLQITVQLAWWALLIWFLIRFTGAVRRWLALTIFAGLAVCAVIHWLSPAGLMFAEIRELIVIDLPWGETIRLASGSPHPLKPIADLTILGLFVVAMDTCFRVWRRGERRRASKLGVSLGILIATLIHGTLVDLLWVRSPYLISFGFLAMILIMGLDLTSEVVRAGQLSREVRTNERRWHSLLENVPLLVAGADERGCIDYVNACFIEVSGYRSDEVLGESFRSFIPTKDQERLAVIGRSTPHRPGVSVETALVTRSRGERRVEWQAVALHDLEGRITSTLSIGTDVTDRLTAEAARDRAIAELEKLKRQLEEENVYLKEEIKVERGFTEIVGESEALRYVLHKIEQVAGTEATVLIEGETGVGKELVARAIHESSRRQDRPFVKVNCAALPATLVESELFGHERGAFTGAAVRRKGRFEIADGGTLFLDEVSEVALELQPKLLRVLQEREFERLGGSETLEVDIRLIAATNRDLKLEVEEGRFRQDLFYRLNVFPITVPPLRDRRDDIPLLVRHFAARFARRLGKSLDEVPTAVLRTLQRYDWPGNVRELQNLLERSVIVSRDGVLRLPERLPESSSSTLLPPEEKTYPTSLSLQEVERHHVLRVLGETCGQIAGDGGAAEILGLPPSTLRSRMKKLGIRFERSGS